MGKVSHKLVSAMNYVPQFLHMLRNGFRHAVKAACKLSNFITRFHIGSGVVASTRNFLRHTIKCLQWAGKIAADHIHDYRCNHQDNRNKQPKIRNLSVHQTVRLRDIRFGNDIEISFINAAARADINIMVSLRTTNNKIFPSNSQILKQRLTDLCFLSISGIGIIVRIFDVKKGIGGQHAASHLCSNVGEILPDMIPRAVQHLKQFILHG